MTNTVAVCMIARFDMYFLKIASLFIYNLENKLLDWLIAIKVAVPAILYPTQRLDIKVAVPAILYPT